MDNLDGCELLRLWRVPPLPLRPDSPKPVVQQSDPEPVHQAWHLPSHGVRSWKTQSVVTLPIDYDDEEVTWQGKCASQWADAWLLHNPQCIDSHCIGCDVPGQPEIRYDYRGIARFVRLPPSSASPRARSPSPDVVIISAPQGPPLHHRAPSAEPCDEPLRRRQRADSGCVQMVLSAGRTAGIVMSHCQQHVLTVLQKPVNFKIGLAYNPEHRWSNPRYGHALSNMYHAMDVIAELDTADGAAYLEATLIQRFRDRSGCMNRAPGGEGLRGPAANGPYFVYIVHGPRH